MQIGLQQKTEEKRVGLDPDREHHEHIYDILMDRDEITWKSIIVELIKTEQMDAWDINISQLSKMYIKTLKKLKEMNLRVSGKVLLCAALLLRIKSSRLVGDDMMEFDRLLASGDREDLYADENYVEQEFSQIGVKVDGEHLRLIPKTPQPRKRKVSVYDLIDALAVALNVRRRRILNQVKVKQVEMPEKSVDISKLMDGLYEDVVRYMYENQSNKISFTDLVPGDSKKDKIYTFVPLLHLTNARKVNLDQNSHFGEIWVSKAQNKEDKSAS